MMKQKLLNRWLWKWHIIGGLISLPFIFLLSITGVIYLFKADFNDAYYQQIKFVSKPAQTDMKNYEDQLKAVRQKTDKSVVQIYIPQTENQATRFRVHDKGHTRDVIYVDPYTAQVTGRINQKETLMYKVRKLHGELLLNQTGEYIIELIASWSIVLILTGIYVWWPAGKFSVAGFFTIRTKKGKRTFWRDTHSVIGFWASVLLLIILAGGMPWTDVFGSQLKWVQAKTNTGYPQHWRSSKGLKSDSVIAATKNQQALSIDEMVNIATSQNLKGALTLKLPKKPDGVFTVSNRAFWLSDQKVTHFDQYSGELVKAYDWSDVGFLMDLRQVAMRLHQGEYGLANWLIVLVVALAFAFSTAAGLVSYLLRKPSGRWGIPAVPVQFKAGKVIFCLILFLGVLFPLFGLSLLLLSSTLLFKKSEWFRRQKI